MPCLQPGCKTSCSPRMAGTILRSLTQATGLVLTAVAVAAMPFDFPPCKEVLLPQECRLRLPCDCPELCELSFRIAVQYSNVLRTPGRPGGRANLGCAELVWELRDHPKGENHENRFAFMSLRPQNSPTPAKTPNVAQNREHTGQDEKAQTNRVSPPHKTRVHRRGV